MKHLTDKFDAGCLVWVLLFKVHDKPERAILKGCIRWTDDDRIPSSFGESTTWKGRAKGLPGHDVVSNRRG